MSREATWPASLRRTLVTLGLIAAAKLADATPPRHRTWEDGIDAGMNREVEAVLNLSQVGRFNGDQARVISDWLRAARQIKNWAPDQLAPLCAIVRPSPHPFWLRWEVPPVGNQGRQSSTAAN